MSAETVGMGVRCDRARSDMTPCATSKDGWTALTTGGLCVGCGKQFPKHPAPTDEPYTAREILAAQSGEHILQFFTWGHLPEHLRPISREFSDLAYLVVSNLPRNPERTVALRKLLEAKDAAVRAMVAK